jgi:hypothetical protein
MLKQQRNDLADLWGAVDPPGDLDLHCPRGVKPRRQLTAYEAEFLTRARSIDEWAEIALALTQIGVTQTEIARRTGLAQPTVSARILRVVKG